MIKILLVDDENYILKSLSAKITDLGSPFKVIGCVTSFNKCLEFISTELPDIIITDICMPDKTGLDLIKILHAKFSSICIIVSSAHNNFNYAQEAISYDVIDYLLKPIHYDHLSKSLNKCLKKIYSSSQYTKLLITSAIYNPDFDGCTTFANRSFSIIYCIIGNNLNANYNLIHPSIPYIDNTTLAQSLNDSLGYTLFTCYNGFNSNEKIILIENETLNISLNQVIHVLHSTLSNYVDSYITSCFTDKKISLPHLHLMVKNLSRSCYQNIILGQSNTYHFDSLPTLGCTKLDINYLLSTLPSQNITEQNLSSLIDNAFYLLAEKPYFLCDIENGLTNLFRYFNSSFLNIDDLEIAFLIQNIICYSPSIAVLKTNFKTLILQFYVSSSKSSVSLDLSYSLLKSCEEIMLNSLSSNLSLDYLSEKLGISSVYLCRLFKKHKQTTPINFFNTLKINKSKEYLTAYPTMSLKDIAYNLGFSDPYYFSKTFKKFEGVSPSQYRNTLLSS